MSPRPAVDRAMRGRVASWDLEGRPGLQVRRMEAVAERAAAEREPAEWEPAEREPAEREPAEREPAEREPAEWEPAEREPAEREPAEWEPAEREPAEREPAEWGAVPGRLAAAAPPAHPVAGVSARVGKREQQERPAAAGWAARIK